MKRGGRTWSTTLTSIGKFAGHRRTMDILQPSAVVSRTDNGQTGGRRTGTGVFVTARGTHVRLLGAFEVVHDGQAMEVGGPVGQAILAVLASAPDTKVLPDQLTAAVWGSPDAVTADNLYRHISRLRHALEPVGLGIVGHRPGYRLPVVTEQVDVVQFDEMLRTARALSDSDPHDAAERLAAALRLWRGPRALDNLTQPGIRRLAAGLDARRLDAEEDLAELELHRGRPEIVLDRLHMLTAAHPLRPRLTAALAKALHGTGRVDEAHRELDMAEQVSRTGSVHPAISQARQAISGTSRQPERAIARPAVPRSSTRPDTMVPFQLPAGTVHFTGRGDHLASLLGMWPDHPAARRTEDSAEPAIDDSIHGEAVASPVATIAVVDGMAGVGKTALVVHAAQQLADRFDDGVLFVDLRGFTPGVYPSSALYALDALLRGLGVPGDQIPPDLDTRTALYRTVTARRRVLIVLDNAADETQLQHLLPASPGCLVLVTSRRRLAGLDDATHVSLPLLPPGEAAALFRALVGDRATSADQQTIEQIVSRCGYLPLAIRIAAARLRSSRASTPKRILGELDMARETGHGLDWLSDGHRAVAAALEASYRNLAPDQQRAFRFLGLHPGTDIEPYALAALTHTTVAVAQRLLDGLHAANLVDQQVYHRYTLHDLVASYTRTLVHQDTEPDQHEALNRLLDHYAHITSIATELAYPWPASPRPRTTTTNTPTPFLGTDSQARQWLDTELDNILAAAHHAHSQRRPDHTIHQSATLRRYLRNRGCHTDARTLHQLALRLAHDTGDRGSEQAALHGLGDINFWQGHYEKAADCYERQLAITRDIGDRAAELTALCGLGDTHRAQDRYREAAGYYEQLSALARDIGDRTGEQVALKAFGAIHHAQGRYEQATDCYQRSLVLARELGNRVAEQGALHGLARVQWLQGWHRHAADNYRQELAIARDIDNRICEQRALCGLAAVHHSLAQYRPAADCYDQALAIASRIGLRDGQFEALQGLGRAHHALGHHRDALNHHRSALKMATELGRPTDQACAHDGLAHTMHALGDATSARHHWSTALDILNNLNVNHTDEHLTVSNIHAHLATCQDQARPAAG
jgi:tetratricopeptide (TPR) repeat protein/DNA-binding SARP family transcriptional activator